MIILSIDPPGPPTRLEPSDITKDAVTLTWCEPDDDGGSPITGYWVERLDRSLSHSWTSGKANSFGAHQRVDASELDSSSGQRRLSNYWLLAGEERRGRCLLVTC